MQRKYVYHTVNDLQETGKDSGINRESRGLLRAVGHYDGDDDIKLSFSVGEYLRESPCTEQLH